MTNKKLKQSEGFTIIEVLIVLAIAGLIMLIVFLAVPGLQRSSRNTQRKSDASRVASAISDFVSNNDGKLPGSAANLYGVIQNAGSLGQYSFTSCSGMGANECGWTSGVYSNGSPAANQMIEDDGTVCNLNGATVKTKAGTSREATLLYTVEVGGGSGWEWSCIQAE